jgi:glycerol-3-phosphate dehydrogenase (NAD(P)+)
MAKMLILGAGVMGSALTVPACDNENLVTLVGSPLDGDIISSIKSNGYHPKLQVKLPSQVRAIHIEKLSKSDFFEVDIVILGVSSPGIDWAIETLAKFDVSIDILALVTKGLVLTELSSLSTFAEYVPAKLKAMCGKSPKNFLGIAGPCIAREIVFRQPTSVIYASDNKQASQRFIEMMSTASYRVSSREDVIGVEACAALKNFFAIGVSTTLSRFKTLNVADEMVASKNPTAALFNQAVREMAILSDWMGGTREAAFDLAGLGDLHVTVGGGRNSRLGKLLGEGGTLSKIMSSSLAEETVEGVDTGRLLAQALKAENKLVIEDLPLTLSIINTIVQDCVFEFDYEKIGH